MIVTLANAFLGHGHDVDLLLRRADGPLLSQVSQDVRIIHFSTKRMISVIPPFVQYLRRQRPRALLSAMTNANVIAALAVSFARTRTRLVLSEHSVLSAARAQEHTDLLSWLMRPLYPKSDAIVAVSNGVANELATALDLPRDRITVIHNPVVHHGTAELAKEPTGDPWLDSDGVPIVLAAGRLTQAKDHRTLILAFEKLRRSRHVRLVILGEGEERRALEQLIAERGLGDSVRLAGFVSNPLAWMARSRLFVLSSRWESFGNVLVEAMACGVPVVATDCPSGPAEILQNGKWGRLVPVGDSSALAEAMNAVLEEPSGLDARPRALDFSVDDAADRYLKLLLAERNH